MADSRDITKIDVKVAEITAALAIMVKSPLDEIRLQQGIREGLNMARAILLAPEEDDEAVKRRRGY